MANEAPPSGRKIVQEGVNPDYDVVFVHGLQGHRENTWTYFEHKNESAPSHKKILSGIIKRAIKGKKKTTPSKEKSTKTSTEQCFWPKELLCETEICERARIVTFGYDSRIMSNTDTVNFTTLNSHGRNLLFQIAAMRRQDMYRPLMFVAHSLGGLIVKSALNTSFIRSNDGDRDVRAVVDSTFAAMFFGTPHRGADIALVAQRVVKFAAFTTLKPYNNRILEVLTQDGQILTELRSDFEQTHEYMIKKSGFETTTFQEGKGLSSFAGFQDKVVPDDSSEMGRNDRRITINKNHMDMCKVSGSDDSAFTDILDEFERHVKRRRQEVREEDKDLTTSLSEQGKYSIKHLDVLPERTNGTFQWLYEKPGIDAYLTSTQEHLQNQSFLSWINSDEAFFWITGRPGSGKSTIMKYLFQDPAIFSYLSPNISLTLAQDEEGVRLTSWFSIGLFITNRSSPEQSQWCVMLQGLLMQLLEARPALVRDVASTLLRKGYSSQDLTEKRFDFHQDLLWTALKICKKKVTIPFKAFILIDGLDELDQTTDFKQLMDLFKDLVAKDKPTDNTFKICFSSRAEQRFIDIFAGVPRLQLHEHTKQDILQHIATLFWQSLKTRKEEWRERVWPELESLLDYITQNANGVFLWAHSVTILACESLDGGFTVEQVQSQVRHLPTEMHQLYSQALRNIPDQSRRKAYLMLEIVLRAQQPVTLLRLALIIAATEKHLESIANRQFNFARPVTPNIHDLRDPLRLQRELITTCKCILEVASPFSFRQSWDTRYTIGEVDDPDTDTSSFADSTMDNVEGSVEAASEMDQAMVPLHSILHSDETEAHSAKPLVLSELRPATGYSQNEDDDSYHSPSRVRDVELMTMAQYRDINGNPSVDPATWTVQLLHRSAKDFLSHPDCLEALLPEATPKPLGNGHAYFLIYAREWLQVLPNAKRQLREYFEPDHEVPFHASLLEETLDTAEATLFFPLLDDLNQRLIFYGDEPMESWPLNHIDEKHRPGSMKSWHYTFPAFAVATGMVGYVRHLIERNEETNTKDDFLNGKEGRPLLNFALWMRGQEPQIETARLLLEEGADTEAKFDRKTAIESLVVSRASANGEPTMSLMLLMLQNQANPNSHYFPDGQKMQFWYPITHLVVHARWIDIWHRIRFLQQMQRYQPDFTKLDSFGVSLAESLFWYSDNLFAPEHWKWFLSVGGKITTRMIRMTNDDNSPINVPGYRDLTFDDNYEFDAYDFASNFRWNFTGLCESGNGSNGQKILRQSRFRRREWYEEDAIAEAMRLDPQWFYQVSSM